jgi:hypothetical protein
MKCLRSKKFINAPLITTSGGPLERVQPSDDPPTPLRSVDTIATDKHLGRGAGGAGGG